MARAKLTRQERSWVLYDVGNSAFVLLATALIPVYFASIAEEGSSVVVAWGYAETVASLILALLMPVLGSLADLKGNKKKFFIGTVGTGAIALAALGIPTAAMGCASSYLTAGETGECFRMGLGVNADVSGFNSSASFDGGVDWEAEGGQWARFLYDGMTQLSRQPWFTVDRCGNRLRYMDSRVGEDGANAIYALGDLATIQMTPPGHRSYIIFDAHYEDHLAGFAQEHCRKLITPDLEQIDKVPEHYRDWHHGVEDAIEADVLKRRDTLEELERDLGFEPGVLVEAVEKWNECCERGEDDFMYPMPPEWLHAIKDPPFYGCRIGGNLYGTKAGLMINDEMQVISTKGRPIPGLYAGWHTAGGACGENSYIGDPILGSLLGDVSLAFCGGYLCGTFAVANEMKGGE